MKTDDYESVSKIGEGTFGEVFKARHRRSGRSVALKRIRLRNPAEGLPKHVLREITALRSVAHPNVLHLFGYFPHGSCVVLAVELMYTVTHATACTHVHL
jgi:serine/threonine protein kinase